MTNATSIILVLISSFLSAIGQLLFKLSTRKMKKINLESVINKQLFLGVIIYGVSALLFILALINGTLVVLYPLVSTSFIWAVIFAKKYLKEEVNAYKYFGIAFIILGSAFVF